MPESGKLQSYLMLIPILAGLAFVQHFIQREDTFLLCTSYCIVFIFYLISTKYSNFSIREILIIGIVSRLILFFSLPNLSDDFYRFIWDGRLLNYGINPFSHTPEFYIESSVQFSSLSNDLYDKLNSQTYHTIYPPISQLIFWISVALSPDSILGSVFVMRLIILLFEIGNILLLLKLLRNANLTNSNALIYALNPLVILELTGNLHFEGVMLFFLLGFIYLFQKNKVHLSSTAISMGIATKLVPLMFLPVVVRKLKFNKLVLFYTLVGGITALAFLPLLDFQFINGVAGSLDLFFRRFEFNGGIFFLFREIGFYNKGYDTIATLGPKLTISALILIVGYCLFVVRKKSDLPTAMIVVLFIQLSLATTVHPWYVIPLVGFTTITKFRFPIIWSLLIFFTYMGYSSDGFDHPFAVITLEYLIVIPLAIYEIFRYHNVNYSKES